MSVIPLQQSDDNPVELTPLEYTQFAIRLKGEPIKLDRRPWLPTIYNLPIIQFGDEQFPRRKLLVIAGRQCEKSTTIGNSLISLSNLNAYLRCLFVTASNVQMREFSDERLRAVIADSPILDQMIGRHVVGGREVQNVQTKRWTNKSKIILRSVYKNADRVRGVPADVLTVDELQDVYTDNLPVIEETLFHCELPEGPISIYCGTPKTYDNPLEHYWSRYSTQNEWVTRCAGCRHWNVIDNVNLQPQGLVCKKCGKDINPVDGISQWVRFSKSDNEWEGFRLPQPIVPYAYGHGTSMFIRHWRSLMNKYKRYPSGKFANEVMAKSHDTGTKPVTYDEVRRCSLPGRELMLEPSAGFRSSPSWAGVDWGTGDESYSIISIWYYDAEGRFALAYAKRYEGVEADPDFVIRDMVQICRKYNVNRVGTDWGFGFASNSQLQKALGADKVVPYYHAGKQKDKVKWNGRGVHFTTHRSRVLQDCFDLIKRGPRQLGVAFVNWGQMETFAKDILSIFTEYSELRRELVFKHPRGTPDDFLHTMCYALLVSQFEYRRPDLHVPGTGKRN